MLSHTDSGFGRPFVLIHGWTCDRTAMAPVAAMLEGERVISVDLLGHGASPKADDYSIEVQARAVLELVPEGAILIGHSMGGQIAVEVARQAPEKIAAIILLDPAQIAPTPAVLPMKDQVAAGIEAMGAAKFMRAFAGQTLVKAENPKALAALTEVMTTTDEAVVKACWQAIWAWDGRAALAAVTGPVLVIFAEKTMNVMRDVARLNRQVMTAQAAGAGHMLQFEVMPQVSAMITRFLDLNSTAAAGRARD